jgi:hypothetical protein
MLTDHFVFSILAVYRVQELTTLDCLQSSIILDGVTPFDKMTLHLSLHHVHRLE